MDNSNLNGALTGMAISAAAYWARYDDDTQRRLRNTRLDLQAMENVIREMNSRGEVLRAHLPVVQDAQVGLALATSSSPAPQLIPTSTAMARPDFVARAQTAIQDMGWPPKGGSYTENGMVKEVGEMTQTFLALTYEEVRCFIEALPQSQQPSPECKRAIFFAANSLTKALCGLPTLTYDEFLAAWMRLFTGQLLTGIHTDPAKMPKIVDALGTNVASVVPLGGVNTDRASRWRITASNSFAISAGTAIATIRWGSEWRYLNQPIQPVVSLSSQLNNIAADTQQVSSTQVIISNTYQINASGTLDFQLTATNGVD